MADDTIERLLRVVDPDTQAHGVEPGTLGEYAEVIQSRGQRAANLLFPDVVQHVRTRCRRCASLLREIQDALAAERQSVAPSVQKWLGTALARHIRRTAWTNGSTQPDVIAAHLVAFMAIREPRKPRTTDEFRFSIEDRPGWFLVIRVSGAKTRAQVVAGQAAQDVDRLGTAGWLVRLTPPQGQPIVAVTGLDSQARLGKVDPAELERYAIELSPPP